jgi:hypothetical protein
VDPRRLTADDNNLLNTLQLELVVQKMLLKLFSSAPAFPVYALLHIAPLYS